MNIRISFLCLLPGCLCAQPSSPTTLNGLERKDDDLSHSVRISNALGINKAGTDYAPTYYAGGMVFLSSRNNMGARDPLTGESYAKIYYAPFDPLGEPATPGRFEIEKNWLSDDIHEGPVAFTADERRVYYTCTNHRKRIRRASKDGVSRFKIYSAVKTDSVGWLPVGELPFNSDDYNCLHPCLNREGTRLFFASDMPGGQGGYDLYYVEQLADGWTPPINLGVAVNTKGNELFPFYTVGNTLFFSSNGHANTLGGLDLYYIRRPLDSAGAVVNLEKPFNSPANDISFVLHPKNKQGFFASDREGGFGKQDIYRFESENELERTPEYDLNIKVTSQKTGKPLQGAAIRLLEPDCYGWIGTTGNEFYHISLNRSPEGNYTLDLNRNAVDLLKPPDCYTDTAGLATIKVPGFQDVWVSASAARHADRAKMLRTGKKYSIVQIELLEGPTCIRTRGIVRVEPSGFPVRGAKLTFIQTETDWKIEDWSDWNGRFNTCLPDKGRYLLMVERAGFENIKMKIEVTSDTGAFQEIVMRQVEVRDDLNALMGLRHGMTITIQGVFFDRKQTILDQTSIRYLECLIALLLRDPQIDISMRVHTDTGGDSSENILISQKRAQNIDSYLAFRERNLDHSNLTSRVSISGRGNSLPAIEQRTGPSGYLINDRLEIVILRRR